MGFQVNQAGAVLSCLGMAAIYVGVLYCCPKSIRQLPRDHPQHILARSTLIMIACALFPIYLYHLYEKDVDSTFAMSLGFHGDIITTIVTSMSAVFLTMLLFAGSLYSNFLEVYLMKQDLQSWEIAIKETDLYRILNANEKLPAWRTYFIGPLTEEFAFRSCMIPLLIDAGWSINTTIFASPLAFGVAHAHHFIEHIRAGRSFKNAIAIVVFQFLYTTVFGIYASFLFLRTGHFFAVFFVHSYCNLMGFPDLSFFTSGHPLNPYKQSIIYIYFFGILTFSYALYPFTQLYI